MLRLHYEIKHLHKHPSWFNLCLLKVLLIMNWKAEELIHILVSISA